MEAAAAALETLLNLLEPEVAKDEPEDPEPRPEKHGQTVMGALKNLGCIESDDRGPYRATEALRLALDLK